MKHDYQRNMFLFSKCRQKFTHSLVTGPGFGYNIESIYLKPSKSYLTRSRWAATFHNRPLLPFLAKSRNERQLWHLEKVDGLMMVFVQPNGKKIREILLQLFHSFGQRFHRYQRLWTIRKSRQCSTSLLLLARSSCKVKIACILLVRTSRWGQRPYLQCIIVVWTECETLTATVCFISISVIIPKAGTSLPMTSRGKWKM